MSDLDETNASDDELCSCTDTCSGNDAIPDEPVSDCERHAIQATYTALDQAYKTIMAASADIKSYNMSMTSNGEIIPYYYEQGLLENLSTKVLQGLVGLRKSMVS